MVRVFDIGQKVVFPTRFGNREGLIIEIIGDKLKVRENTSKEWWIFRDMIQRRTQ